MPTSLPNFNFLFNGLSSRSVEKFLRTQKEIKKMSGNFGYMGRSNPWGDLDQMCRVGRYGGHNHVCNIWWLSVKGCGCGERVRGVSLPSLIDLTRRPYDTTVWPCDSLTTGVSWALLTVCSRVDHTGSAVLRKPGSGSGRPATASGTRSL